MNIAIVCEYNPFHFGHLHQIKEIKTMYPNSNIIAIMSGNVVQRGEFPILDKYHRTKIALEYGIDCVVELPAVFSLQSAENFAKYSVKIIDSLNCDYISFGVESNIDDLLKLKEFIIENQSNIRKFIENNKGISYNKNLINFLKLNYNNYSNSLIQSNNILALEYMKELNFLNSKCKILPIKRINGRYNSNNLNDVGFSASSIRHNILKLEYFKKNIPESSYQYLQEKNNIINKDLIDIFAYKLLIEESPMDSITGYENGLENVFRNNIKILKKFNDEYFEKISSKKYSTYRLKRLAFNYILNIKKDFVDDVIDSDIDSIRILGFRKNFDLSSLSKNIKLTLINKDLKNVSKNYKKLIDYNIKTTKLIYNSKKVNDYYNFPIKI